jgi:hypothetical protein
MKPVNWIMSGISAAAFLFGWFTPPGDGFGYLCIYLAGVGTGFVILSELARRRGRWIPNSAVIIPPDRPSSDTDQVRP